MTDKTQAARLPRFGLDRNSPLARFWRWWSGELAALLPQWLRQSGETAATSLLVEIDAQSMVLHRWVQGVLTEQGRHEFQSGDADANGIAAQALFSRVHRNGENVALLLASSQYLSKRIELPLAAQENLHQVLGFEMDRNTPFKADQVYFGYRIVQQDSEKKRIVLNLIVAPRATVDASIDMLARRGIPVRSVYVSDPRNGEDGNINLMPNAQRATESSGLGKLTLALFLLTLALGLAAILIPIWQKRQASIELIPLVDQAKQQAMATEALRQEQEKLATEFNFMLKLKQDAPPVIVVLDELSGLLPDDTWVQQFNLKGKELQIQGETASSSKLITLIESSRIFHNSNFRSPLTKGSTPNSERYQLVADVKPLTAEALMAWPPFLTPEAEPAAATAIPENDQQAAASGVKPAATAAASSSDAAPANPRSITIGPAQSPAAGARQRRARNPRKEGGNQRRRRQDSAQSSSRPAISINTAPLMAIADATDGTRIDPAADTIKGGGAPNETEQ